MVDVYFRISTHLLALEVARDSIERSTAGVTGDCDPANSRALYESVATTLHRLIADAPKFDVPTEDVERLRDVQTNWDSVTRLHSSDWSESATLTHVKPMDRCLRSTDLVGFRLAIERDVHAILISEAR